MINYKINSTHTFDNDESLFLTHKKFSKMP